MLKCLKCRRDSQTEDNFCNYCGAPLRWSCPQCGSSVTVADNFCCNCARAVSLPASLPQPAAPKIDVWNLLAPAKNTTAGSAPPESANPKPEAKTNSSAGTSHIHASRSGHLSVPKNIDLHHAIATRGEHCLALSRTNKVFAWGRNKYGRLGTDVNRDYTSPITVELSDIIALACSDLHSVALNSRGIVFAWGSNYDGSTLESTRPVRLNLPEAIVAISCGSKHTLALGRSGRVYSWGSNSNGQLGLGNLEKCYTISVVQGLPDSIKAISAGAEHSLALTREGEIFGWGSNLFEQILPIEQTLDGGNEVLIPQKIDCPGLIRQISAGSVSSLALGDFGKVYAWGQIKPQCIAKAPQIVPKLNQISWISAGWSHNLAVSQNGSIWAWGKNEYGVLGDGTVNDSWIPIKVAELSHIVSVAAGANHSLAIDDEYNIYSWGWNYCGQLGNGTTNSQERPTKVHYPYLPRIRS